MRSHRPGIATGVAAAVRRSSARGSCVAVGRAEASFATLDEGRTMVISPDREAEILRYYHVERWRAGTIARQLGIHHNVVSRVLAQAGLPRLGAPPRHPPADSGVSGSIPLSVRPAVILKEPHVACPLCSFAHRVSSYRWRENVHI